VFCSVVVRWHTSDPYPPLALGMVSSLISIPASWVGGASVLGCWMDGTSLDEKKKLRRLPMYVVFSLH
jgi:hypothetical protein